MRRFSNVTVTAVLAGFLLALPVLTVDAASGRSSFADTRDPREFFFTQTFGELPEEMQAARDQGKLGMLLFFEAESCPYCEYMLRKVFSQRRVQNWYNKRFISIAVDIHGDVELTDFDGISLPSKVFSDHRRVFMTPVILFLDLNGVEMYRHLGMIKTADEFLLLGEYIEGGHFFDTEYKVFSKARGIPDADGALMTPGADSE